MPIMLLMALCILAIALCPAHFLSDSLMVLNTRVVNKHYIYIFFVFSMAQSVILPNFRICSVQPRPFCVADCNGRSMPLARKTNSVSKSRRCSGSHWCFDVSQLQINPLPFLIFLTPTSLEIGPSNPGIVTRSVSGSGLLAEWAWHDTGEEMTGISSRGFGGSVEACQTRVSVLSHSSRSHR